MRPVFTRLFLIFSLALALLLPSSPARADAAVELTSVTLSVNGQDYPFRFRPDQVDYDISYTSADPVELTVTAQAAEACKLRIDNVPYEDGHGSATISVSDEHIINLQAYSTRRSQLYTIHVHIVPPETPAPNGGQKPDGAAGNSGQGSGSGGQGSDSGNAPEGGGNNSGSDGAPAGGPPDPVPTDAAADPAQPDADPAQPDADPADEVHTTHLILYIGAPFLFADGTYIQADTSPYLVTDANGGGYTMVPVRFIAEALGAVVSWDGTARKVGIDLDGRHFELVIGELVPGTPVAAVIRDSRTFVPLRYVMESFGARVEWTQAERRIDIYYAAAPLK